MCSACTRQGVETLCRLRCANVAGFSRKSALHSRPVTHSQVQPRPPTSPPYLQPCLLEKSRQPREATEMCFCVMRLNRSSTTYDTSPKWLGSSVSYQLQDSSPRAAASLHRTQYPHIYTRMRTVEGHCHLTLPSGNHAARRVTLLEMQD